MFHIIPVEVCENFLEPLVHNLVIAPTVLEFAEEYRPTLSRLVVKGGEDGVAEVGFDSFAVANIEISGPVVR